MVALTAPSLHRSRLAARQACRSAHGFAIVAVLGVLILLALLSLTSAEETQLLQTVDRQQTHARLAQERAHTLLQIGLHALSDGRLAPAAAGQTLNLPLPDIPAAGLSDPALPAPLLSNSNDRLSMTGIAPASLGLSATRGRIVSVHSHSQVGRAQADAQALLSLDPQPELLSWRHFDGE